MDGLDEGEELGAVYELDGFAGYEVLGGLGEFAGGDDDGFVSMLGGQEAEHFADDGCADGIDFPLFALNECSAVVPVEGQIDTAVGSAA